MSNKELTQVKWCFVGLGVLAGIIVLGFMISIFKGSASKVLSYDVSGTEYVKSVHTGNAIHFEIYSVDSGDYEVVFTPFAGTCKDYKKNVTHVPSSMGTIISKMPVGMDIPISFCLQNVNNDVSMKVEVSGKTNGDTAFRTSKLIYDSLLNYAVNNTVNK